MTRAVFPHTSARAEWLLVSLIDRVASLWTEHPRLMEETTTMTQTQGQTPQFQMMTMTTLLSSPATKLQHPNLELVTVDRATLSGLSVL